AGAFERLARSVKSEIGCQLADGRDATLADPGALTDPGIRRIELRGELVIGDHALGQIRAAAGNLRAEHHRRGYSAADCCAGSLLSCANSSRIFSRNPLIFRSIATLIALAKPNASVEPWLFTAIP